MCPVRTSEGLAPQVGFEPTTLRWDRWSYPVFGSKLFTRRCVIAINATRMEWGTYQQSLVSLCRMLAEVIRSASRSGSGASRSRRLKSVRAVPAQLRSAQPRCGTCRRRRRSRHRGWSVAGTGHGHSRPRDCKQCRPPTDTRRRQSIGQSPVALRLDQRDCDRRGARRTR